MNDYKQEGQMPWGKHKGTEIDKLSDSYLSWMFNTLTQDRKANPENFKKYDKDWVLLAMAEGLGETERLFQNFPDMEEAVDAIRNPNVGQTKTQDEAQTQMNFDQNPNKGMSPALLNELSSNIEKLLLRAFEAGVFHGKKEEKQRALAEALSRKEPAEEPETHEDVPF